MQPYINIHTHFSLSNGPDTMSISNFYKDFTEGVAKSAFCSLGCHPWYLENFETDFATIATLATQQNVLAIGECGLDKICETGWELQVKAFSQHILLANRLSKPLIVHCVKAHNDVLLLFKEVTPVIPVIFHGFNKNPEIGNHLLNKGHYLSFGKSLLGKNETLRSFFRDIDATRFFLETDDAAISIKEIYETAALIRQTNLDDIILQAQKNFNAVFRI